ncbi:MAG: hypothetical protein NVS1B11_11980 [Terriglobales bacterium]
MHTLKFRKVLNSSKEERSSERGVALLTVLLALLLITAIGFGILFMSSTETSINANYRDTQKGFFAMRAGLEEARDRMRFNSNTRITVPATMPTAGTAGSIVYITNPAGAADVVDPTTPTNPYFDDEFCHEKFSTMALTNPGPNIPCPAGSAVPQSAVSIVPSVTQYTNTPAALTYKWVRITKKENWTVNNAWVDNGEPGNSEVCYSSILQTEVPISALGYASCDLAEANEMGVLPVYIVTSLAITPKGTRRIGQYEVAGVALNPPPGALGLDGPGATFAPRPSSNNFGINGNDSGLAGYQATGGTGTCNPSGAAVVPAVSTGDAAGQASIVASLTTNPNRSANYTGTTPAPNVVNAGAGGTGLYGGSWSSPAVLNNFAASIANSADQTFTCAIGAACNATAGSVGTPAHPLITYVSGDFNMGSNSGAGILIVTGTLSFSGNFGWSGLVLVIGQGIISESGGGNGSFNGTLFAANTNSRTAPYAQLATLGNPIFSWNGAGSNFFQYNSCWANIGNTLHYLVISTHEEMY